MHIEIYVCAYTYMYVCTFRTQAGFKEREDRIAELEEFINDQVTELDKMEAAMKQTVANKEIVEKELSVCVIVYIYVLCSLVMLL